MGKPTIAGHPSLWWLGWVVFVIYGSLLPFEFAPLPWAEALQRFVHLPYLPLGVESRADWIVNGVLYLPVGALGTLSLIGRWGDRRQLGAVLAAVGLGLVLASTVELAQEFFPGRTVSQNDLIAEAMGSLLGALAVPPALPQLRRLEQGWRQGGPVLVRRSLVAYAVAYVGWSLFPYARQLNGVVWQAKLASDHWRWWLAEATRQRGWIGLLLWLVEVVLSIPFGLLIGARRRPWRPGRAACIGLALGLLIECGQLATASGLSQGASLLSRGQHQPYNALRIAKGALWAVMLILAMRRLPQPQSQQQRLCSTGLCLGLVLALAVLVWERMAFFDPPWHIHNWPVTGLLEQGWLGAVAWFALLAVAVAGALRRARQGDLAAAGIVGALLAFVCCAMLNTLTDTPRMLCLLVLVLVLWLWLGATADKAALHRSPRIEEQYRSQLRVRRRSSSTH